MSGLGKSPLAGLAALGLGGLAPANTGGLNPAGTQQSLKIQTIVWVLFIQMCKFI